MKISVVSCLVSVAVGLAGCASPSANNDRPTYVKPGLVMLTADQAARRGINIDAATLTQPPLPKGLDALDASAVTVPEGVKVYTLNRAEDPYDPDIMHEEHVVYRRESTPRWRLDPPADEKILVGPRVTDGRQSLQPMLDKELTTFLADQRKIAEANQKAIASLFQAVQALNRQQQALLQREMHRPASTAPAAAGDKSSDRSASDANGATTDQ